VDKAKHRAKFYKEISLEQTKGQAVISEETLREIERIVAGLHDDFGDEAERQMQQHWREEAGRIYNVMREADREFTRQYEIVFRAMMGEE